MKEESDSTLLALPPLCWGAASDIGMVRDENQDAFLADPESGLFIVSDGIGGHKGGAIASKIITEVLPVMLEEKLNELKDFDNRVIKHLLKKTILELNEYVRAKSISDKRLMGMCATLVMALLNETNAYVANMGDSRAYLFRENKLSQLTEDHNVVGLFLREGLISKTRAKFKYHPARGQLTRCIGLQDKVSPYICTVNLNEGDRLLLCTDGLTGLIYDEEIAGILQQHRDPQVACQSLIDAANSTGGDDNITVVLIDWQVFKNDGIE